MAKVMNSTHSVKKIMENGKDRNDDIFDKIPQKK